MQLDFADEPSRAFSQSRLLYFACVIGVLVEILVAEVMIWGVWEDERGFADLGSAVWMLRLGLAFYVIYLVVVSFMFSPQRSIAGSMEVKPGNLNLVVLRSLQSTQLLRWMNGFALTVAGIALFCLSGERPDIYVPAAISLALLLVFRPTRKHWEMVYSWASREYPGVSPTPWAA